MTFGEQGALAFIDPHDDERQIEEERKRDAILDDHEATKPEPLRVLRLIAHAIANRNGSVSCPEALRAMRAEPDGAAMLEGLDPRFAGALFRERGWVKRGTDNSGSHGRTCQRWVWAP